MTSRAEPTRGEPRTRRRIAVSGASGLVGRALCAALSARGDSVIRLVRGEAFADDEVHWDWERGEFDSAELAGADAVVHLAGAPIARRWTASAKHEIAASRIEGTRLIAEGIAALDRGPSVLVCASAVGYYGEGQARNLDEASPQGRGWLAQLCGRWERASDAAVAAGVRVVRPRIGIVLSPDGGALARMLPVFRLGLGGRLGTGQQGISWIGLHDLVRVLLASVDDPQVSGALNATTPQPVSNDVFTRTLARVLRRPAVFTVPAFAITALYGEMGRRLLLDGDFVQPSRLGGHGFRFAFPVLEDALRYELNTHSS